MPLAPKKNALPAKTAIALFWSTTIFRGARVRSVKPKNN